VASTLKLVSRTNKYLEHQAPWKVAKEDVKRAGTILYVATEALRIAAVQLMPIMPSKTKDVLEVLNALGSNTQWGGLRSGLKLEAHDALFPRLELPKE
ncbi:MAG: methionine--tRNA ligase, partial [Candidatus Omnitrophica bacterium]|nr:methionine--tRNA ligase [Candidatus Omnitrophota bacterium]